MRPLLLSCAALLLVVVPQTALADGVLLSEATPVQREQAQSRFRRGKELMDKGSYDEAVAEFRASHDIVASPNTRLELARCMRAAGRLVPAYAELGRTMVEAKELVGEDQRYQRAYDAAAAERAQLEPDLGFVILTIENPSDGTRVVVGGEEIRRAAWSEPAPVVAGSTEIHVQTPGHADLSRSVTLAAGDKMPLTIDAQSAVPLEAPPPVVPVASVAAGPVPIAEHGPDLRPWAYVAGGVGVAGLGTLAIFGVLAQSSYDDLQTACRGALCPAAKHGEISSGKTDEVIANVGLTVGILGAVAGGVLFVLSLPKASPGSSVGLFVSPTEVGLRGDLR
jgi:hypothetical protein